MSNEATIDFYDKQSEQYSRKRYEGRTETYFQFLFKKRRKLFLDFVSQIAPSLHNASGLEIGCADGVIVKKLLQKLPQSFSKIVGLDISPKMIDQAKRTTTDPKAEYYLRGEEPAQNYDLIIELGVHSEVFENEMKYIAEKLNISGYFIHSVSGYSSLHAKIKLQNAHYRQDYLSYSEYEEIIKKYFKVVDAKSYGLFVPKLWSLPFLARVFQPIFEILFNKITPSFFHERIYLLQKKS